LMLTAKLNLEAHRQIPLPPRIAGTQIRCKGFHHYQKVVRVYAVQSRHDTGSEIELRDEHVLRYHVRG
jgi:hypothetical protein